MKILINDHRKIFAIQEEFSRLFPDLKIEFYGKPSRVGDGSSKRLVKDSKTLGECRVVHSKGELTVSGSMTISDLQQSLNDAYGLTVMILRRSKKGWIEITENGRLTLEEQNQKAILS